MEDRCVMCGEIVPEGRQVCPICERKYAPEKDDRTIMEALLRSARVPDPRFSGREGNV